MSNVHTTPEPGWYHAAGDEPGTVRLWNGTQWVGFPQRDPNVAPESVAEPFAAIGGQVRLRAFAVPVQISLSAMAALYAMGAIFFFIFMALADSEQLAGGTVNAQLDGAAASTTESSPGAVAYLFAAGMFGFWAMVVLGPVLFLVWFWRAYTNMSLWRENQYDNFWAVLG